MENVEFFDMCMCIVFAFHLIRAKEVRKDIEVKRSEEKWREVMACDVSPVAMFVFDVVQIDSTSLSVKNVVSLLAITWS